MDFLSDEQKAKFAAINARLGLGPEEYTCQETADQMAARTDTINMHTTGDDSHFKPHMISVGSVQEMRKIVGTPTGLKPTKGHPPHIPPPPTEQERDLHSGMNLSELKANVSPELIERAREAAIIYVLGNDKLVDEYTDLINALFYPGRIAAFTGHTLSVPAGGTLHIGGDEPAFLNFGQLVTGDGATIRVTTQFAINFQQAVETS